MESGMGRQALLVVLLWAFSLEVTAGDQVLDDQDGFPGRAAAANDLLLRLGRATWEALESWVGPQPLRLVAENLSATLWIMSLGISAALTTLCRILGDLLAASGISGDQLVRSAALGPGEVQRVLLWGLASLLVSWLLSRLRGLLVPMLHWVKLCLFLAAFFHVATSQQSPTAQAGMLLGLWVLYTLLGHLVGSSRSNSQLDATIRSLERKVEALRQELRGPRNWED